MPTFADQHFAELDVASNPVGVVGSKTIAVRRVKFGF